MLKDRFLSVTSTQQYIYPRKFTGNLKFVGLVPISQVTSAFSLGSLVRLKLLELSLFSV